ncbi:MAG: hypothetical protein EHM90_01725 [Chloroflexi bacterium]|nr:MAG: hypothetical protein EHM90_01725 [Chloroflexota bacterium]
MTDVAWRTLSSRIGWFVAATFLVAMVLYALGQFHIIVPEPEFIPAETYVDDLIAGFEHAQAHWIVDLTSSLLLAAGFVGLAILGATLRRVLDRDDARGAVLAVTFLLAGAIGAASQVLFVGATEVATNPEYCDCGFLAEEIVSRQMAHDIALNVVFWMTDMSIVVIAIGLLAFAALARASGWVPDGLAVYARVLAGLAFLSVVWGRVVVPLLMESGVELDYFRIGDLVILLIAGVLVPIWAAWVARAARSTPEVEEPPPAVD